MCCNNTELFQAKENTVHPRSQRFSRMANRQTMSMITLSAYHPNRSKSGDKLSTIEDSEAPMGNKTPVTDIKLEPIKCRTEEGGIARSNGILTAPSEIIRNRLSSGSTKSRGSQDTLAASMANQSSGSEVSLNGHESTTKSLDSDSKSLESEKSRPSSGDRLDKLTSDLDAAIQKATDNTNSEFDKKLGT